MAFFQTPMYTPRVTHRQDFCPRYELFQQGKLEMRDLLQNISLHPLITQENYFFYNASNGGMNLDHPGLLADLLDELAERAGFTWRTSFGVMTEEDIIRSNRSWTSALLWAIETYDVAVDWWNYSLERMEKGVAYIEPWFDGSVIVIGIDHDKNGNSGPDKTTIALWNWLKPFTPGVWWLIIFNIFGSALVYMFIEYMHQEREERSYKQWFGDNLYLSSLNFSQNFQYAPRNTAGRIFGISMSLWALLITATYTANLASMLVEENTPTLIIETLEQIAGLDIPVCTYKGTTGDDIIRKEYTNVRRVPKNTELEAYQGLRKGECGFVATYHDNWLMYQGFSEFNPQCNLEWIGNGRVVEIIKSGFAVKADSGNLCTSIVKDVLNIHMIEIIKEGVLEKIWQKHRDHVQDKNCSNTGTNEGDTDTDEDGDNSGRRLRQQRSLLFGPASSESAEQTDDAGTSGGDEVYDETNSLNARQMAGTFFIHWLLMALSIITSIVTNYRKKKNPDKVRMELRGHLFPL